MFLSLRFRSILGHESGACVWQMSAWPCLQNILRWRSGGRMSRQADGQEAE